MSKKRSGNIMTCILSAQQFIEVAEGLIADNCEIHYIRPFFVNAGLACELIFVTLSRHQQKETQSLFCFLRGA